MPKRNSESLTESPTREGASLISLYDDALMHVLLRTRASDHANLRLSCKRIRDMIDSVEFRKERSVQGFAEVEMKLLSPFEQYNRSQEFDREGRPATEQDEQFLEYYDDLGYIQEYKDYFFDRTSFHIFVDGRPMHKFKQEEKGQFKLNLRLLPLEAPFGKLVIATVKSYPKVPSLKKTVERDYDCNGFLLYIDDCVLPYEYRSTASTVGPLLIKQVLRVFEDFYTVAIYIPYQKTQYTEEDAEVEKARVQHYRDEMTDDDIQAEDERQERHEKLTEQDMRQFFRAGFFQVNDRPIIETASCSYVFTTPDNAEEPILSLEEAMNMPIARKTRKRPEPRGLARELRLLVENKAMELNGVKDGLEELSVPPRENPFIDDLLGAFHSRIQALQKEDDELSNSIQQRTGINMEVDDLETRRLVVRSMRVTFEERLDEVANKAQRVLLEAAETKKQTFETETREGIKNIFDKSDNPMQLVLDSDVIHVATAANNMFLLEMLLEYLPASEKLKALNGFDREGLTPLMVAAGIAPTRELTKGRATMEALINMGADKNIVHASRGLSALGHFREIRMNLGFPAVMFNLQGMFGSTNDEETPRIEALLRPANGPTPADDAILQAASDSDSHSDMDSDMYDEDEDEDDDEDDESD